MDEQMNDFAELHLQSLQAGMHVCLPPYYVKCVQYVQL
jgi:hypothetical protein